MSFTWWVLDLTISIIERLMSTKKFTKKWNVPFLSELRISSHFIQVNLQPHSQGHSCLPPSVVATTKGGRQERPWERSWSICNEKSLEIQRVIRLNTPVGVQRACLVSSLVPTAKYNVCQSGFVSWSMAVFSWQPLSPLKFSKVLIGGLRGGAEGAVAPLFSCIFKMFLKR